MKCSVESRPEIHVCNLRVTVYVWIISQGGGRLLFLSCVVYFWLVGQFITIIRELKQAMIG